MDPSKRYHIQSGVVRLRRVRAGKPGDFGRRHDQRLDIRAHHLRHLRILYGAIR